MKYLISVILFLLISTNASKPLLLEEKTNLCEDGLCVVQFNAAFNSANEVTWLNELTAR